MAFDLGKFFDDIFKPAKGEIVTVMYDTPHGDIKDRPEWQERRKMAEDWRTGLAGMADRWGITVNPTVTYEATGSNNADLPSKGKMGGNDVGLTETINGSTIIIAMPEFSATAPLYGYARRHTKLRVGSMPGVAKFMEESGLSADYAKISERCKIVAAVFEKAVAADVEFSSGHRCHFDLPKGKAVHTDDGILHPEKAGGDGALSNLPAGEVFCVPNEDHASSRTAGELPEKVHGQTIVYVIKNNRVVDVKGEGQEVEGLRKQFATDTGWQNLAEFAIGLNDKAKVTGIVLEDEKAGFHWAYGRSDHFGGSVGVKDFPTGKVVHQDIVYAKDSPIVCKKLDLIMEDGSRKTMIVDGVLKV